MFTQLFYQISLATFGNRLTHLIKYSSLQTN